MPWTDSDPLVKPPSSSRLTEPRSIGSLKKIQYSFLLTSDCRQISTFLLKEHLWSDFVADLQQSLVINKVHIWIPGIEHKILDLFSLLPLTVANYGFEYIWYRLAQRFIVRIWNEKPENLKFFRLCNLAQKTNSSLSEHMQVISRCYYSNTGELLLLFAEITSIDRIIVDWKTWEIDPLHDCNTVAFRNYKILTKPLKFPPFFPITTPKALTFESYPLARILRMTYRSIGNSNPNERGKANEVMIYLIAPKLLNRI